MTTGRGQNTAGTPRRRRSRRTVRGVRTECACCHKYAMVRFQMDDGRLLCGKCHTAGSHAHLSAQTCVTCGARDSLSRKDQCPGCTREWRTKMFALFGQLTSEQAERAVYADDLMDWYEHPDTLDTIINGYAAWLATRNDKPTEEEIGGTVGMSKSTLIRSLHGLRWGEVHLLATARNSGAAQHSDTG
jgi:hypothetical protein